METTVLIALIGLAGVMLGAILKHLSDGRSSALRELEASMDQLRQDLERYKRSNQRLRKRVTQLEKELHEERLKTEEHYGHRRIDSG